MKQYKTREQMEVDGRWITIDKGSVTGPNDSPIDGSAFVSDRGDIYAVCLRNSILKFDGVVRGMIKE